ncbi:MAG TPA: D-alanine--D-alanine ligase [Candidatus Pullichristensenella excrementigallinarum]|uniref:D-alanine--D-alanine ligase n=1 Tax=Candidatus Pullichristensenella excrementigallinarum TaxID=2840907 RepID=A0A9D1IC20_9FIRM|nr:D-alanine--D-alanine ligase [Candidatus Pullichristensenella excrementigallinarum]
MDRLTVGILFGGLSEEHDVSVKSAREVARALDGEKYRPVFLHIGRDGRWRQVDAPGGRELAPAALSPDRAVHGICLGDRQIRLDVVLPVLHGRFGEDGAMQGLLELAGIPYVGCGVAASAMCMDKALTYLAARRAGVETPEFFILDAHDTMMPEDVGYPVFVKPARSGSSFGVNRVERAEDLLPAILEARRYDAKVLLERAVSGREVGCAILEEKGKILFGALDMIELSGGFFRIHQEKNPEAGSQNAVLRVPAPISEEAARAIREAAAKVFREVGGRGLCRVDMFLTPEGRCVLNEVNTFPGLTSYSRYPRMMAAAGIDMPELLDRLIGGAIC